MIHGTTIQLVNKVQTGTDAFGAPVYADAEPVNVENVLVGEPAVTEIIDLQTLYGKRAAYMIAIPKGDTHAWKEQDVIIFGERYHVFTEVTRGIEENVPGPWHHKYGVERYE